MRFMMMVKADQASEAGVLPSEEQLAEMAAFNEEMVNSGVMLSGEGLHASSKGARVEFYKGKPTVTHGPFTKTKDLVAGFWLIQAGSLEEAVQWAQRVPFEQGEVEVRQVLEQDDFGEALTPELRAAEQRMREQVGQRG
jgi:hypothetical protein